MRVYTNGMPVRVCASAAVAVALLTGAFASPAPAQVAGRNVNMVSGTKWPDGDPYLQRQNEPSVAASTRNPMHLLAGANDYRTVDIPFDAGSNLTSDAWLGLFKSYDGGQRWISTLLPGYPQDRSQAAATSPLKGYAAAADPVVRPGTHGLLYYSGMVFDRTPADASPTFAGKSAIFVARFIDNNNQEDGDTIAYAGASIVARSTGGASGEFFDKPWLAVDIPRGNATTCRIQTPDLFAKPLPNGTTPLVTQAIPAGNAYVAYTRVWYVQGVMYAEIRFSTSTDCGQTWSPSVVLSRPEDRLNQGASIAIDPNSGRVFVTWRRISASTTDSGNAMMAVQAPNVGGKPGSAREVRRLPRNGKDLPDPEDYFEHRGKSREEERESARAKEREQENENRDKDKNKDNKSGAKPPGQSATKKPVTVDSIVGEFDQPTADILEGLSFRTNAYPSLAIDGTGRLYMAWTERGFATLPPGTVLNGGNVTGDVRVGDARIVISTSTDGVNWSNPVAAADEGHPGHQLMPTLTFGGGKLVLVYYDLREDVSQTFRQFVDDRSAIEAATKRHTLDMRASFGTAGAAPAFQSSIRVSDYLVGYQDGELEQLQFNAPNLPMFKKGTAPFMGDYVDVALAPAFVPTTNGRWAYNTNGALPVFHAVWTDNRDVREPTVDPDATPETYNPWAHYTAPSMRAGDPSQSSIFDPSLGPLPTCSPENSGSRNQNIYTARLSAGLVAGSPGNTKPLSTTLQRAFVVFAQNTTATSKVFRLGVASQPVGGRASFRQFDGNLGALTSIDVTIPPYSTVSRSVYATSTDAKAQITITVNEITANGGTPPGGGLSDVIILNPDATNPAITNPAITNPAITNPAITNPAITNPAITNPAITNPAITNAILSNPAITNSEVYNPAITNPAITNPAITNPAITNPAITNPAITNPAITNPAITNPAITNTDLTNPAITNPDMMNPAITNNTVVNPAITNPAITNPAITNPAITNPAITNPAITNPAITNPAITNPAITNGSLTDVTWTMVNTGNTTAAFNVGSFLVSTAAAAKLCSATVTTNCISSQLLLQKTYVTPTATACLLEVETHDILVANILNPKFVTTPTAPVQNDPAATNGTIWLAPGETAVITLRLINFLAVPQNTAVGGATIDKDFVPPPAGGTGMLPTPEAAPQGVSRENGVPLPPTTTPAVVVPVGSTNMMFVTEPSNALVGSTIVPTVRVQIVSAAGTGVQGVPVTLTLFGASSGAGLNGGNAAQTDANGIAAFPSLAVVAPGVGYQLQATAGASAGWVAPAFSAPFTVVAGNTRPVATPLNVSTTANVAVAITLAGTDAELSPLTFAVVTPPAHGSLTGTVPDLSYTPFANYYGPDSFTFTVNDGAFTSNAATVTITVGAGFTITTPSLPDGIVGQNYSQCVNTANSSGPLAWSISGGTPPPGIALNVSTGCFDWATSKPVTPGVFTFTVQAAELSGAQRTATAGYIVGIHAIDQQSNGAAGATAIMLGDGRRVAQVFTSGSVFGLTGVELMGISTCGVGTTITAGVYPVTGHPSQPDTSGSPLASSIVTVPPGGYFPSILAFPSPVAIPQHGQFAVALSFVGGSCLGTDWPTNDSYPGGGAWTAADQSAPWQPLSAVSARTGVPMFTLVRPTSLVWHSAWRPRPVTATLGDGRILIIGVDATAELYDPAFGTLTPTGSMATARDNPTATVVGGKVYVIGGTTNDGQDAVTAVEVFDPTGNAELGSFSAAGSITVGRANHTATALPGCSAGNEGCAYGGKILVAGGSTIVGGMMQTLGSAELYDPAHPDPSTPFNMRATRTQHTATLIPGTPKVLLAGGLTTSPWPAASAEVYDPDVAVTGPLTLTANEMSAFRLGHTSTALTTGPLAGKILLVGGYVTSPTADLFDPATKTFSAGPALQTSRGAHSATLLPDGRVVIAGGQGPDGAPWPQFSDAEIYTPPVLTGVGAFSRAGNLQVERMGQASAVVTTGPNTGRVLVAGGWSPSALTSWTTELFDPMGSPLVITTAALPDGPSNTPYSAQLATSGGTGSISFELAWGALPAGLGLSVGGLIDGTPTGIGGPASFVVKATDLADHVAYQQFMLRVNAIAITTSQLASAVLGQAYSYQLAGSGAGALTWSFDANQLLPPGLTLSSSGLLGWPTPVDGGGGFRVKLQDVTGQVTVKWFYLSASQLLTVATTAVPHVGENWNIDYWLSPSGGQWPMQWSLVSGSLPPGVSLGVDGHLTGPATYNTGTYPFNVRVVDAGGQTATKDLTLGVYATDQWFEWLDADPQQFATIESDHKIAQTVRVGMTGELRDIRLPVSCSSGNLTVAVHDVSGNGQPGTNVLSSWAIEGASLPSLPSIMTTIPLPVPLPVSIDARIAFVIGTTGTCVIQRMPAASGNPDTYLYGDGYADQGAGWQRLSDLDATRPDLSFRTLIDPLGALVFDTSSNQQHTATLLPSGKVLLVGGNRWSGAETVRLFDPATRTYATGVPQLNIPRYSHTATALGGGVVLVVGGRARSDDQTLNSAEIYNPADGSFTLLPAHLADARQQHQATLLADGRVLITGGYASAGQFLNSAELYTPGVGFTSAGSMVAARGSHAAVRLSDGSVLLTGGTWEANSAERYIPVNDAAGAFATTGAMVTPRMQHAAVLLTNGTVLIAGGVSVDGTVDVPAAEVYNPAGSGTFSATGVMTTPRRMPVATLLNDGRVAITGGEVPQPPGSPAVAAREIYDPVAGTITADGEMVVARGGHSAVLLDDGRVFLHGGYGWSTTPGSAEFYTPGTASLAFSTVSLDSGQANVFYSSGPIAVHGNIGSYGFTVVSSALPSGLSLTCVDSCTAATKIEGTTAAAGTFTIILQVKDSAGHVAQRTFMLRISDLRITTTSLPNATAGMPYPVTFAATGGTAPYAWNLWSGSLPPGLTLGGNGTISGSVNAGVQGTSYFFTVQARSLDGQTAYQQEWIWVDGPMQVTTPSQLDTTVQWQLVNWMCMGQSNSHGDVHWSPVLGGPLPRGLTFGANGCFNGQALETGTFSFAVQAQDSSPSPQTVISAPLTLTVSAIDQDMYGQMDTSAAWTVGGTQKVAQILRTGFAGQLRQIGLPVACASGNLTIEMRDVTGTGAPGTLVLGAWTIPGASVPPFTGALDFRWFPLPSAPALSIDKSFAVIVGSTGSCTIQMRRPITSAGEVYRDGDGFSGDGTSWTRLAATQPLRPTLPMQTHVVPSRSLVFSADNRAGHTATLMTDGESGAETILLAGGFSWPNSNVSQVYDVSSKIFTPTANQMLEPRSDHTATKLANGRILIVGGRRLSDGVELSSVEVYDPSYGTFSSAGRMSTPRAQHRATLLDDGTVLVTGGVATAGRPLQSAEVYHPGLGTFSPPITMLVPRLDHSATLLTDGRVLLTGGAWTPSNSAEFYDPTANAFFATGEMTSPRSRHAALRLACGTAYPGCLWAGQVLIVGGSQTNGPGLAANAEIFNPAIGTGTFTQAGALGIPRMAPSVAQLPDGTVAVVGGEVLPSDVRYPSTVVEEVYDPFGQTFRADGEGVIARRGAPAVQLADGRLFAAGGWGRSGSASDTGEVYSPGGNGLVIETASLPDGQLGAIYSGSIVVHGGIPPYNFQYIDGALPAGMSLMSLGNTAQLVAAPPGEAGTFRITIRVIDTAEPPHTAQRTYALRVDALRVTTATLQDATAGSYYYDMLATYGGFSVVFDLWTGALPPGLSMDTGGSITGTVDATALGGYGFVVRARSSDGQVAYQQLGIYVKTPDVVPASALTLWSVDPGITLRHLAMFGDGRLFGADVNRVSRVIDSTTGAWQLFTAVTEPKIGTLTTPAVWIDNGGASHVYSGYEDNHLWSAANGSLEWSYVRFGCCNLWGIPPALAGNYAVQPNDSFITLKSLLDSTTVRETSLASSTQPGYSLVNGNAAYVFGVGGLVSKWDLSAIGTGGQPAFAWKQFVTTDTWWTNNSPRAYDVGLSHGAVDADGNVFTTTGGDHAIEVYWSPYWTSVSAYWRSGQLFKLKAADGQLMWGVPGYTTTPPVTGRGGLVFVGAIPMPAVVDQAHQLTPGSVDAYDVNGMFAWSTATAYMPQDLFAGDDGRVYVVSGSGTTGEIRALNQLTGHVDLTISNVPSPLEIMLKDGVIYAVGESRVTAIRLPPGFALNYDPLSSWPVRQHDNQRTSAK